MLDELVTKASEIARNDKFGKSLDQGRSQPHGPRPGGKNALYLSTPAKSDTGNPKFTTKLAWQEHGCRPPYSPLT